MINRRQFLIASGLLASPALTKSAIAAPSEWSRPFGDSPYGGYAHPEWLVEAAWLGAHSADPSLKVIAIQPADDFDKAHIPGAVHIASDDIELKETSEALIETWRTSVAAMVSGLGVAAEDTVIIYDGGNFHSARLWWVLDQIGFVDKRMLNGGLPAWLELGGAVDSTTTAPILASASLTVHGNDRAIAAIDKVVAAFDEGETIFIDARDAESFAKGHIPGARSVPVDANAAAVGPKFWKPVAQLRNVYAGIPTDARVIPYCGGGIRSAATYFALQQLGYSNVSLFSGSWAEWSSHPELPVATGS